MTEQPSPASLFDRLQRRPPDPILGLTRAFRADPRPDKLDLGLGVFRDDAGKTPVFGAVKAAERQLFGEQETKAYTGPEGDLGFLDLLGRLIFADAVSPVRIRGVQTPGGTGALRTAGELIARANPGARVISGLPSWPNHEPLLAASELEVVTYRYFDPIRQAICFDELILALEQARSGDVVLLHGCCHNPSGADPNIAQWRRIIEVIVRRGVLPLVDFAYHGVGRGLEEDAVAVRMIAEAVPALLLAYSCSKNFGLYRERAGALYLIAENDDQAAAVLSNVLSITRANWSMPPDHGAAVVRTILDSVDLTSQWEIELAAMRARIVTLREALAGSSPRFAALATQSGFFSQLALSASDIEHLRNHHGIYMAGSGRINIAGLSVSSIPDFSAAVTEVLAAPHRV